ncbi:pathogenesis-related protein PRB1-3-like [Cucurbita maxima]|uniref:Pathogenesis-related protein PRB1-3-like n=1 Tax=Cucurbita maxima TaxID=3661 RepID=A0A6J1I8U1_CUCMA|nr:pathogenesis-related protein PRB1-3-like [Cucurbita maxima]
MDLFKLSLLLFYVQSFAMLPSFLAQDSPQDYVDEHNKARAEVGVGPVQWDESVANFARQYANERINDCKLKHSDGSFGENISYGFPDLSGTAAVQDWVKEKQFYDPHTNTCAPHALCGHYTQVVWRNSVRIGCAKVICTNNLGTFITCNYDPPGNIPGERPYSTDPLIRIAK